MSEQSWFTLLWVVSVLTFARSLSLEWKNDRLERELDEASEQLKELQRRRA
jgi:hypothetical protein